MGVLHVCCKKRSIVLAARIITKQIEMEFLKCQIISSKGKPFVLALALSILDEMWQNLTV